MSTEALQPATPRVPDTASRCARRVLLITEQLGSGGKRSHIDSLSAGLEAIGWHPEIYDRSRLTLVERALLGGPARVLDWFERGLGHRWLVPVFNRMTVRRLAGLDPADVYHSQDTFMYLAARRAAHGRPVALTVHGPGSREVASAYDLDLEHPTVRWLRELERLAYCAADAIIAVDLPHAEYVRGFGRTGPVWVIPNFVDTRRFHAEVPPASLAPDVGAWVADRPLLLCPRRLVPKNGVAVAIEAMRVLADRGVAVALLVAGAGPQAAELTRKVVDLGVGSRVRLLGDVAAADMPGLARRAALVIVPSVPSKGVEEATSISVLEAQACARPVIASRLGGLPEIVADGVTGLLVPPGDATALATAVQRILDQPAFAASLGAAAAARVREHHSHVAGARRYTEVYRALGADTDRA